MTSNVKQTLLEAIAHLRTITDAPRLEAEVLLGHVLNVSRTALLTCPERTLTPNQRSDYQTLIRRRAFGYPLPYLTGRVEFYGLEFVVTPEVLIPRSDTETLVELALARRPVTVVDVGTGSGCIAISLAVHLPDATIRAIDISPAALAVAQRNVEQHSVGGRVRLMVGNLLNSRPSPVDLIVSNPPYISTGECASLPTSVRNHEPRLALDGGPNGLDIVRQLLTQAPAVLNPGGGLLIEIGADQAEAASHLARTFFPRATVRVHPDLAGRDRVLEVLT
ncbi:MAG: peptide chain release factor N(5)-glutamine methyltransferase [Chloroflexi bacterium]|nr:peptide chain release factor N(5)-glutamine methyltransferase [Chloroflexota bacterium]